jgi:hypothetical protein
MLSTLRCLFKLYDGGTKVGPALPFGLHNLSQVYNVLRYPRCILKYLPDFHQTLSPDPRYTDSRKDPDDVSEFSLLCTFLPRVYVLTSRKGST